MTVRNADAGTGFGPTTSQVILRGRAGETGPLYTRLLVTDPAGPNGGVILMTAEVYRDVGDRGPVFPVWASDDDGVTWERIGEVDDQHLGVGNRYQPTMLELDSPFGEWPRGTVLLAGSAIPSTMAETHLVLYCSTDAGRSWEFVSEIDSGGPADYDPSPTAQTTAIWEPHLTQVDDQLVCHYADERYKHRDMLQTIVHRTTRDGATWSDAVLDVGVADRFTRPGMFVGTGLMPDGMYRAVIEIVGPELVPVHLIESADGVSWGERGETGRHLVGVGGHALSGTPNVTWRERPDGSVELLATGRLSVGADGEPSNFALINRDGGRGDWHEIPLLIDADRSITGENSGYSHSLRWTPTGALLQATTVRNDRGSHDIVVARAAPIGAAAERTR